MRLQALVSDHLPHGRDRGPFVLATALAAGAGVAMAPLGALRVAVLIAAVVVAHARVVAGRPGCWAWCGVIAGVFAVAVQGFVSLVASNGAWVREWDFLAFYVWGRTAAQGLDFYDPAAVHLVAAQLPEEFSSNFVREILDVGFFYPPPSMFLFAPLGALSLKTAALVWALVVSVSVALSGVVFGLVAIRDGTRLLRIATGVAITFLLGGTERILHHQQTGALMMLCACGILASSAQPASGAWAAAGIVIKPILAFPSLLLLLRRNLRAMGVAAACLALLVVASIVAFGAGAWRVYLSGAVAARLPDWQFSEIHNQSLSAVLLRAAHVTGNPASHPGVWLAFWLIAGLATAVAAWTLYRCRAASDTTRLAILSSLGCCIYPGTGASYGLLLAFSLASLANLPAAGRTGAGLIAAGAFLVGLWSFERTAFAAAVVAFVVALAAAVVEARRQPDESHSPAGAS